MQLKHYLEFLQNKIHTLRKKYLYDDDLVKLNSSFKQLNDKECHQHTCIRVKKTENSEYQNKNATLSNIW